MLESYKAMAEFIAEEFDMSYSHETVRKWARRAGTPIRRARTGRRYVRAEALRTWFETHILC